MRFLQFGSLSYCVWVCYCRRLLGKRRAGDRFGLRSPAGVRIPQRILGQSAPFSLSRSPRAHSRRDASDATPRNSGPQLKISPGAQTPLSATEQKIWDDAISFYITNEANKDLQINIDLILLKNQLADFEDCDNSSGKREVCATPAYRERSDRCWNP